MQPSMKKVGYFLKALKRPNNKHSGRSKRKINKSVN